MRKSVFILIVFSMFIMVSCAVNKEIVAQKPAVKNTEIPVATASFTATQTATAMPTAVPTKQEKKATAVPTVIEKHEEKPEPRATERAELKAEAKPTLTAEEAALALVEKIRRSQESRMALTADLIIDTTDGATGGVQQIAASVIIKKKDKFIVKYTKPAEQLLVSDGKTLWVYTPQLEQAIKQKVEDANLNMNFYVEMESSLGFYAKQCKTESSEDGKNYIISMTPKKKGTLPFDNLNAGFSKESLLPSFMNMKAEGMDIKVRFEKAKAYSEKQAAAEPSMDDINFIFRPPQGTEVIEGSELLKGSTIIK